jgi:CDP-glucose 4,6-dehydratase
MLTSNILVTGASGFTGSWLTRRLLLEGAKVITLRPDGDPESPFVQDGLIDEVTCVRGTILDYDLLLRTLGDHGVDSVFHLAGVSVEGKAHEDPRTSFDVNIRGTYNLLECCRIRSDTVKRVVVASSDKVYGDSPTLPYTEDLQLRGTYPYDVSKSCADMIARSYYDTYRLPVTVARFANIYGGGDLNWSRLVPNTIRRLFRNERPLVRSPDRDTYKRDFLYIKDQVEAYMALLGGMARPEVHGLAFNFGLGSCISVEQVVAKIRKIMNREDLHPIFEPSDHGEIVQQQLSCERAARYLGWMPTYPLDEGLAETVDWYTRHLSGSI